MNLVSILIPTFNAANYISDLITKLSNQVLPAGYDYEIIIVDSSSTDNTREIIQKNYSKVKLKTIKNNEFDHGGTRNYLASLSKGDYLLFMTQDAIPYDDFLIQNLIISLGEESNAISYARQIPKNDANPLEVFARNFNYPDISLCKSKGSIPELGIKSYFNSNVCSMYKRQFFDAHNGFPEKIILNEDMILASRAILGGYTVNYVSDAKVYHSHNYNVSQQFKRYFDIGMAFHETSYLLKEVSNEKEGFKMIKNQINYLLKSRNYRFIHRALIENIAKFMGYYLGKKHFIFPVIIKKQLSAYMK